MKLLHLSDLHLGLRLYDCPMIEDQEYILKKILAVADAEKPDGVLIAGDIFDTAMPPVEALRVFDDFLVALADRGIEVFVISGNHDSGARISFGSRLMDGSGVHIAGGYSGQVRAVTLEDEFGPVDLWLLPFVKPAYVQAAFPEARIDTWTDALRTAVEHMGLDTSRRNILVSHQFVTGSRRSDSEEVSVGGADNVDASVFDGFDYVALGHLHSPQNCGSERVRYCGTPLKYSFSEADDTKSVTVVELGAKGELAARIVELAPRHEMRELRGTYNELTALSYYNGTSLPEDYVHITLTDEEDIFDALGKLRLIYHNLLRLDYDNVRTRSVGFVGAAENVREKRPEELFAELYEKQNGQPMSEIQTEFVKNVLNAIREGEQ